MVDIVGSKEELEAFARSTPAERRPTASLRGILAETAACGLVRYDWKLLQTLVAFYLDKVLVDYEAEQQVELGPQKPLPTGETPTMLRQRLIGMLSIQFPDEAPFTIQRLCELLLEPHKHYTRIEKLALALEKLVNVTSTVPTATEPPPRPRLQDLPPINCNPRNPDSSPDAQEDGRKSRGGNHQSSGAGGEAGFGLASAALANSSHDPHYPRQGTPELEEALGHLNEAGVAARAAPKSPLRDVSPGRMDVDAPSEEKAAA